MMLFLGVTEINLLKLIISNQTKLNALINMSLSVLL